MDLNDRSRDPGYSDLSHIPDVSFSKPPAYDDIDRFSSCALPPKYEEVVGVAEYAE